MNPITINVPENLGLTRFEIEMTLAGKWYEEGKLTAGQAAEMVGLSKKAFIELLGKYGFSVFGYDFEEMETDLKNV